MNRYFRYLAPLLLIGCTQNQQDVIKDTQDLTSYHTPVRQQAFSEEVFGHKIHDPYRWMETEDDELRNWMLDSAKHTSSQFNQIPGRQRMHNAVMKLMEGGDATYNVTQINERVFYLRRGVKENQGKLYVKHKGAERLLVDPGDYQTGSKPAAIHNYTVSPSGRYLAFHISEGGAEIGTIRFIDTLSGQLLKDTLSPVWGEFKALWQGDHAVYATVMTDLVKEDPLQAMQVVKHQLGGKTSMPVLGFNVANAPEYQPNEFPIVAPLATSDWLMGYATGARPDYRLLLRHKSAEQWHAVIGYEDRVTSADIVDDTLYFISKKDAPNGRLFSLDLSRSLSIDDAKLVLDESQHQLQEVITTRDGVIINSAVDGYDLVRTINPNGKVLDITLPQQGIISDLKRIDDGKSFTLSIENAKSARKYYTFIDNKFEPMGIQAHTHPRPKGFVMLREEAISADGTKVPVTIYGSDKNLASPSPAVLYSYGGYGHSLRPWYRPMMYPFIDEGGIWVDCHVRGGGEKGRAWHEGGRGKNKPNGHADFIACAEHLVKTGRSLPQMIGGYGGSMGGVLVGPAVLKRPDLIGHAILSVATLNPTRILAAQNGMNQVAELGDPRIEAEYNSIYEMDAYEWLNRAQAHPDIMLDVGLNDQRVELWGSGKFAARYQALDRGPLVLIRADVEAGHGIGSTKAQKVNRYTDVYTFMLNRSGHSDFQMNSQHN